MSTHTRNISIAGHAGSGKTTLVEQLLATGKAIEKAESVESGKTVSDFTEREHLHHMSISTSLTHLQWLDHRFILLDTPGASDFIGEIVATFRTSDSTVLVVNANSGVQIGTIQLWRRLDNRKRPRMIFVNRLDEANNSFEHILQELDAQFHVHFVPLSVPIIEHQELIGVYDLINDTVYTATQGQESKNTTAVSSEHLQALRNQYKEKLIEAAAEGDDELTEKFLETEELNLQETWRGLMEGFRENRIVPVFAGSGLHNLGLLSLLNFFHQACPAPDAVTEVAFEKNGDQHPITISSTGDPAFFIFKTRIDQFSGKLSFLKVMRGVLRKDMELLNERSMKKEKIGKLYLAQGKHLTEVSELSAGEIGVTAKLHSAQTNDTYTIANDPIHFRPLQLPKPVYSLSIHGDTRKDEDKLSELLQRVTEEDHTFYAQFNAETKENVVSGMGELHLQLILEEITTEHKISIHTQAPKIAYRETVTKRADNMSYRHKKQSGGHGQFAEVLINLYPLERGQEFQFENRIRGGSISKGYIPGVKKGLQDALEAGPLAGYPVVDVGVELTDGKEHSVDSSELAFRLAARGAANESLKKGNPILLEPIMALTVFVEEQYLGDILSDISSKRGRVLEQKQLTGSIVEIRGHVPQAELLTYCIDLRAITSGTGSFEVEFDHYATVTGKIATQVIAQVAGVPA